MSGPAETPVQKPKRQEKPIVIDIPSEPINLDKPEANVPGQILPEGKTSRVSISKTPPYEITRHDINVAPVSNPDLAKLPKPINPKGIAIIDDARNSVVLTTLQDGTQVVGTHYEAVYRASVYKAVASYDISNEKGIDGGKITEVLNHILKNHKELGISVVNLSLSVNIKIDDINHIIQDFAKEEAKGEKITTENIHQKAGLVRLALLRLQEHSDQTAKEENQDRSKYFDISNVIKNSELLNNLSQSGVASIFGAGNDGKDTVNLFALFSPNSIFAGGIKLQDNSQLSENSANNSTVDAVGVFDHHFNINGIGKFVINGTSLAAPQISGSVIELQQDGFDVKKINEILRLRMAKSVDPKFNQLIIHDFADSLKSDFTQRTSLAELIKQSSFDSEGIEQELAALKTAKSVQGYEVKEIYSLLKAINQGVSSLTMSQDEWKSVLEKFKSVPTAEKDRVSEKMAAANVNKVSELLQKIFP